MVLVAGVVGLVAGAGLFGYRWYSRPTTLTVAVGSLDGEATKLMSALASRLTASNAPVRLKLVETPSALEAADMFSSSKTDLAVAAMSETCRRRRPLLSSHAPSYCLLHRQDPRSPTSPA